jgi:hypothetical protein
MVRKLVDRCAAASMLIISIGSIESLRAQDSIPSPDSRLYAVRETGRAGERERFTIFSSSGKRIAVLPISLADSNSTLRVGIRGCDQFGWIDNTRFFCEGSVNPSSGVYRWFHAISGKELGEAIGTQFTWSPNKTVLASFGNVPHFTEVEYKSDFLVVGKRTWPRDEAAKEQHWFRSPISWSPEGKQVAIVDHQRRVRKALYLETVDVESGEATEHRLKWPGDTQNWPPAHDFKVEWTKTNIIVRRGLEFQSFARGQ